MKWLRMIPATLLMLEKLLPSWWLAWIDKHDTTMLRLKKQIKKSKTGNKGREVRLKRKQQRLMGLKLLKYAKRAMPLIILKVVLAWALQVAVTGLVIAIQGFITTVPSGVRWVLSIMFFMTVGGFLLWFGATVVNIVRALLGINLIEPDPDVVQGQILDAIYRATDSEVCYKVGLYPPKNPDALRPISNEAYEVEGVTLYNLEFNKAKSGISVDVYLFRRLIEKNLLKLIKMNKVHLAHTSHFPYKGKLYAPLLIVSVNQDNDSVTLSVAVADENSIELVIHASKSDNKEKILYDED